MLETIWFVLWALLWAVYFILDGFDLGLGALLPFLGKNESERRIMYNAAGPFWDGNEVWLISAGGVTFAAFPKAYAVMFSALYAPLLLLLFALIFRAVSFEFRNKVEHDSWRALWDGVHFLANLIPCVLLGVAFANLFMGIPIDVKGVYHGNLLGLLNIYGLAGGVFFLCMFLLHGSLWLAIKSTGSLQTRAVASATFLWPVMLLLLVVFLVLTAMYTKLYANFLAMPVLFVLPLLALAGLVGARVMLGRASCGWPGRAAPCSFLALPSLALRACSPA
jgi:cytochrome d oxidase, subunit II (cydB)